MSGGEVGNPAFHINTHVQVYVAMGNVQCVLFPSMDNFFCQIAFARWRLREEVVETGVTE